MNVKGTRAVIYTRVSLDEQRVTSHDDQARNCQKVADREGWRIQHRYTDHGISGTRSDRPQYQAMLAAASDGKFDVVLLNKLDRLGRDSLERERALRKLEFDGTRIVTSDGYDSSLPGHKMRRGFEGPPLSQTRR
jgi:DNA invertase Pin-like site-specific DNA recombinase